MILLFSLMVAGYALGAAATVLSPTDGAARRAASGGAVIGGGAGLAVALGFFAGGTPLVVEAPALLSVADGLVFRLDALGAFFLALVGLLAVPCGIYGAGYSEAYEGRYSLRLLGAMLNLFLLTMSLVPCAGNVLTFLLMWEGMSLTSYFLVLTETGEPDTVQAAGWYLAMTHAGLALVLAAFLLLAGGAETTAFGDLRAAASTLSPVTRDAVFLLAVLGFGSKAGIIPLHVWLPRAHPAAPSHVSALMSGVMIKLGVYGLLRVGLDLLGGGPAWWGALLVVLGAVSAVLGVLYALMENDLKRLLAYSSVENIGLIFIAVGTGALFLSLGTVSAATLALSAGLYHALNHAAFKGLLFLGAGSVLHATRTRDMNRLGGLIRRLPWSALCFLIGALAIAGLPPLNGFVSEWLLFQSLLPGIGSAAPLVAPLMTLAVGILALTGGLAAAAFVKAFGITFLAIPRSPAAEHAHEAPLSMRIGLGILAVACAGLGLAAVPILSALGTVLAGRAGLPAVPAKLGGGLSLSTPGAFAQMSPILVALGLVVVTAGVWLGVRFLGAEGRLCVGETWGCGRVVQTPRMEYTSTAFAEPLRRVFTELYRPTKDLSIDFHPESRYFVQSIEYRSEIVPWFERYLYAPLIARVTRWAAHARAIQSGSAHAYLTYLVIALLGLLVMLLVRGA
ncbi:MAG TPA: hydrogenase 4 subunit B [Methylomirabilota bacterium]|nr:hydrogenase 4 subunit B [Methylomirabilota bacterium]